MATKNSAGGVCRSLRLLKELKKGERGIGDGTYSYGIDDAYDKSMQSWTGTISGPPNSVYEGRIYQLKLICSLEYPDKPPTVKFQTPINMRVVNKKTGVVEPELFPMLGEWLREFTMEDILRELKSEMMCPRNRRLAQPPKVLHRSYRLLKELKRGKKGNRDGSVSYVLDDADDVYMQSWTGTLVAPRNTVYAGRVYQLKLFCSLDYPKRPPTVRFQRQINMSLDYPKRPPTVRFQRQINMSVVNQDTGITTRKTAISYHEFGRKWPKSGRKKGQFLPSSLVGIAQLEPELFPMFDDWHKEFTMEDILDELKIEMMSTKNQRLAQPPEGALFFSCNASKPEERVTVENEEQADLPTHASNIAEEMMNASTEIPKEVAREERGVNELKTLDGPRKSGRQTREPTWLKDYHKSKSQRKY